MAVEPRRGCGFRKVGGLYLVGEGGGRDCCRLPIPLSVCPTCSGGVKQTRGWTWIDPRPWLAAPCAIADPSCPGANPDVLGDRVGLLWIGEQFYPSVEDFNREAATLGLSRRVSAIPRGFVAGVHWVFLAHPKAVEATGGKDDGGRGPGVFRIFRPRGIEVIVRQSEFEDEEKMAKLRARGLTPVAVPDDDPDHQGTAYDVEDAGEEARS